MNDREHLPARALEQTADAVRLGIHVPRDSRFFEGHFDGHPLLPGVAQVVAIVDRNARRELDAIGIARRIQKLKFEAAILPGAELILELERAAIERGWQVRFRIIQGGELASSGSLVYSEVVDERAAPHETPAPRPATGAFPSLSVFMPHRPPMLILDSLADFGLEHALCTKVVRPDDVLVEAGTRWSGLVSLELFAQTAAAHAAYGAYLAGSGMRGGALLGARKLELHVPELRIGDRIAIEVRRAVIMPPVAQYECTAWRDHTTIATGTITVAETDA